MRSQRPPNSCRRCGSTNYHQLFARDGGGVLRHNGSYQCSGCQLTFTRAAEWRSIEIEDADLTAVTGLHHARVQNPIGLNPT